MLGEDHEIGIYNSAKNLYTTVAIGRCLNFSDRFPISALFKIRNGCERVVYFTDHFNKYRVFNLTNTQDTVDPDTKKIISCPMLDFSRDYKIPKIELRTVQKGGPIDIGGSLEVGTYAFAVRYLDKELNPTDWIWITKNIAIGSGEYWQNTFINYEYMYDGGSNNELSPYYVPKQNKVIQLSIDSTTLDLDFKYIQFAVIKRTSDEGVISGVDILNPTPIFIDNVLTMSFTYTGLDSQVQEATSIDEIFSERQRIEKVKAHVNNNQKLFLANIENAAVDYSAFQRAASKIKVQWTKEGYNFNSLTSTLNVKSPEYYYESSSFMESEVYALGIVYILKDGSKTPVFHIPGRAPDSITSGYNPYISATGNFTGTAADGKAWDTGEITSESTVLGDLIGDERWRNVSTATAITTDLSYGFLGYHESNENTYPQISTCDNHVDGYWGRDWQGNLITPQTKIRHHRMPGPEFLPTTNAEDTAAKLGLWFTNVEYPSDDIVGHIFVHGSREVERTVQHRGMLLPLIFDDVEEASSPTFNTNSFISCVKEGGAFTVSPFERYYAFVAPETLIGDKFKSATHFKLDYINIGKVPTGSQSVNSPYGSTWQNNWPSLDNNDTPYEGVYDLDTALFQVEKIVSTKTHLNFKILAQTYLQKSYIGQIYGHTQQLDNKTIANFSVSNNAYIIKLDSIIGRGTAGLLPTPGLGDFTHIPVVLGGCLYSPIDVFNNLNAIEYVQIGSTVLDAPVNLTTKYELFAGDVFLSKMRVVETDWYANNEGKNLHIDSTALATVFPDSDYNFQFRHGGPDRENSIYNTYPLAHDTFSEYLFQKIRKVDEALEMYSENYNYNKSFSQIEHIFRYRSLPFNHEMCKMCEEQFPYRIYYSLSDNQESTVDKNRIILISNYKDLEGSKGSITDLFNNFNQIYATTPSTIFHIPTNPQIIKTEGVNTYLGTGETLSIPAMQLKVTDYSFGGQEDFKSRVNTEYGTFYVDSITGRPLLLTNQLEDLSLNGLRTFWQNNGKLQFLNQFCDITGKVFPYLSTISLAGVGYSSVYDPRYKRIIVHKKDYKLLPVWTSNFVYNPTETDVTEWSELLQNNTVWFNSFSFYFYSNGDFIKMSFEDAQYFENLSFTLSYSFLTKSWVSFHSYLPYYMFNGSSDFFSLKHFESDIFRHNSTEFLNYYGTAYPHIIDFIADNSPLEVKTTDYINYVGKTSVLDAEKKQWVEVKDTFNKVVFYNSKQSSGYRTLRPKSSVFEFDMFDDAALVTKVENQWRINDL
jgi:hypothetical protein